MIEPIICYLRRSGWAPQSVESVRPDLPRWERRLRYRGVNTIPILPVSERHIWDPIEARAHKELILLMLQASSMPWNKEPAHHLRNLLNVRAYKP